MSLTGASVIAGLFFSAVVGFALCATYTPRPAPERTLLVGVDLATGAVRGLILRDTEAECLASVQSYITHEYFEIRTTERLDCRVPK